MEKHDRSALRPSPTPDADEDSITFIVGGVNAPARTFTLSIDTIANSTLLDETFVTDFNSEISFPDVDPGDFEYYIRWLNHDKPKSIFMINDVSPASSLFKGKLTWDDCRDLTTKHTFGTGIKDEAYKNYILSEWDFWLRPDQPPDLDVLEDVIGNADAGIDSKHYVIDRMFASAKTVQKILKYFMDAAEQEKSGGPRPRDFIPPDECLYEADGIENPGRDPSGVGDVSKKDDGSSERGQSRGGEERNC